MLFPILLQLITGGGTGIPVDPDGGPPTGAPGTGTANQNAHTFTSGGDDDLNTLFGLTTDNFTILYIPPSGSVAPTVDLYEWVTDLNGNNGHWLKVATAVSLTVNTTITSALLKTPKINRGQRKSVYVKLNAAPSVPNGSNNFLMGWTP